MAGLRPDGGQSRTLGGCSSRQRLDTINDVTDKKLIWLATTDYVPAMPGKVVIGSTVLWSGPKATMTAAAEWIQQWARDNGYDAVVGLRFEPVSTVSGGGAGAPVYTSHECIAYGTAVNWQD